MRTVPLCCDLCPRSHCFIASDAIGDVTGTVVVVVCGADDSGTDDNDNHVVSSHRLPPSLSYSQRLLPADGFLQVGSDLTTSPSTTGTVLVEYGKTVALSATNGSRMLVGAPGFDYSSPTSTDVAFACNDCGGVFLYELTGTGWELLSFMHGTVGEGIGERAAISADGSRIVVRRHPSSGAHPAEVYDVAADGTLTQVGAAFDCGDVGDTVSMSSNGSTVALSCENFGQNSGRIQIYEDVAASWSLIGTIDGDQNNAKLGTMTALTDNGNRIVVSAQSYDSPGLTNNGIVRVFDRTGSTYTQVGSDVTGTADLGQLGYSLDISGDGSTFITGAPQADGSGTKLGVVQVYEFGSDWQQKGTDIEGVSTNDRFGWSVAINQDGTRFVGSSYFHRQQRGHILAYDFDGSDWTSIGAELEATDPQDFTGYGRYSVSITSLGDRFAYGIARAGPSTTGIVRVADVNIAPSTSPSSLPSTTPSSTPSATASDSPSANPSGSPSLTPTAVASSAPSTSPSGSPSLTPTVTASASPSGSPSANPSGSPSISPSVSPTVVASSTPSTSPSTSPSTLPSVSPSSSPSVTSSTAPSVVPSTSPSTVPSMVPSVSPTITASDTPSESPSVSPVMSAVSDTPSVTPTTSLLPSTSNAPSMGTILPTVTLGKFDWDIESLGAPIVLFNSATDQEEITLSYNISLREAIVEIFEQDCVTAVPSTVVNATQSTTIVSSTHGLLEVGLDIKQDSVVGSGIWTDGNGAGLVDLCVRIDLIVDDGSQTSVNFHEQKLFVTIGLTQGFEVTAIDLERINPNWTNETVTSSYDLFACQCNSVFACESAILSQGSDVYICVWSNSTNVEVSAIEALTFTQGSFNTTVISGGTEDALTAVLQVGEKAVIRSQLVSDFFNVSNPANVLASGEAILNFTDTSRLRGRRLEERSVFPNPDPSLRRSVQAVANDGGNGEAAGFTIVLATDPLGLDLAVSDSEGTRDSSSKNRSTLVGLLTGTFVCIGLAGAITILVVMKRRRQHQVDQPATDVFLD